MLCDFFTAQWKHPVKNDWTEQVKLDLIEFELNYDSSWIKNQSYFHGLINAIINKGQISVKTS